MAKINARGATEVARIATTLTLDEERVRFLWVLRSDGKVLRRTTGTVGTGYKVLGGIPASLMTDSKEKGQALLAKVAVKRGHEVTA